MKQWVGILLGFIVVVALVLAYMYRSSNFEIAPPNTISSAPSGAPLVEAPAQAPVAQAPAPAPMPPVPSAPAAPAPAPAAPAPEPTPATMSGVISTSVPPAPPAPAPSVGVSMFTPDPTGDAFEPAYEGEYAEIEN